MKANTHSRRRLVNCLHSFGISIVTLIVLVLCFLTMELITRFAAHILVISLLAALIRWAIAREGIVVSVVTGVVTAIVSYTVLFASAMSSI